MNEAKKIQKVTRRRKNTTRAYFRRTLGTGSFRSPMSWTAGI